MSLPQKIVQIRKTRGYSQEELSTKAIISLRTLQRIEKGESEPRGHTLRAIAEVLEVPVEELMDFTKKEDTGYLQLMNLSALSYWVVPLMNILLPMALWLFKRDKIQGAEKLGRQIVFIQLVWTAITYSCLIGYGFLKIMHMKSPEGLLVAGIFLYVANTVVILYVAARLKKGEEVKNFIPLKLF